MYIEPGNPNPRLIMLIRIDPYPTFIGTVKEWFPFYISSGKYSIGKTGNIQPFGGAISIKSKDKI